VVYSVTLLLLVPPSPVRGIASNGINGASMLLPRNAA
jgi:hypothetical protein